MYTFLYTFSKKHIHHECKLQLTTKLVRWLAAQKRLEFSGEVGPCLGLHGALERAGLEDASRRIQERLEDLRPALSELCVGHMCVFPPDLLRVELVLRPRRRAQDGQVKVYEVLLGKSKSLGCFIIFFFIIVIACVCCCGHDPRADKSPLMSPLAKEHNDQIDTLTSVLIMFCDG